MDVLKTGNWKQRGSEIEIALEGSLKTYKIQKLNNEVFEIHNIDSDEQLKFQLV